MRSKTSRLLQLLILLAVTLYTSAACMASQQPDAQLTISTAASLLPAFEELGKRFAEETGIQTTFNAGATTQLAQQIQNGAPADLLATASGADIKRLATDGDLLPESVRAFAVGRLVVWTLNDATFEVQRLEDLLKPEIERIAIANPAVAPYGLAARQALEVSGLWEAVQPKLVFGGNVRQALQFAETGNADAAIVALSLANVADGRTLLLPQALHAPLQQTIAVVTQSQNPDAAQSFIDFLLTPQSQAILERYGYSAPATGD